MSLRLKINAIVGTLTLAFVCTLLGLQFDNMRESVHEEVVAANRVASQILGHVVAARTAQGTSGVLDFVRGLGRLRSNDITLLDDAGRALYRSPPSSYKAGRDAPAWFAALVSPTQSTQSIDLSEGRMVVRASPSRAVLDAWDRFGQLLLVSAGLLLAVNVLVFWIVGRTVRPFARIVAALDDLQAGRFDTVLPPLKGSEAAAIGAAFNHMVEALRRTLETERWAARAERELLDSRELTRWIDRHIEQERHLIARELHDELGQSVTAIRSMALSIAQRVQALDAQSEQAARLIAEESSRLYDAMHGLIPRLTPLVLDNFGLREALGDLAERTRRSHDGLQVELLVDLPDVPLSADSALALYRAAQEGLTNALRHGRAPSVHITLHAEAGELVLDVVDSGQGLDADWSGRRGHHGLRWLSERVEGLGGRLTMEAAQPHGAHLSVRLPFNANSDANPDATQ